MGEPKPKQDSVNKVFDVTLPSESSDERDPDAVRDESEREQWLRDNVPPHHF
jgi:hypothetical protein